MKSVKLTQEFYVKVWAIMMKAGKKPIFIVFAVALIVTIIVLLCSSILISSNAYEVNNGTIIGDDAKIYSVDGTSYIISSNAEKIVISSITLNECTLVEEFMKVDIVDGLSSISNNIINSFYGTSLIGDNLYIICSFKDEVGSKETKVFKYSINSGSTNNFTAIGYFVENETSFSMINGDNILLMDSDNKNTLILFKDIFTNAEGSSIDLSMQQIFSVRQNVSGSRAYVVGTDAENKDSFVYLTLENSEIVKHDAGLYIRNDFNFVTDALINDSENKFYEIDDDKFSYEFNSYSSDSDMKAEVFKNYILVTMGNGLIYAIDPITNEAKRQLDTGKNIVDMGTDGTNLFVVYKESGRYYISTFKLEDFENVKVITYNSGIELKSEDEINSIYSKSKPLNNSNENIYSDMADLENFTTSGHAESLVMDDGLRAINFYRKLYCLAEIELDKELSENAHCGAVLSLVTDNLSNPSKPDNMNDEFYHKAMMAFDKNCVKISENLTKAPITDAIHYLFSSNYYFREKALDGSITKIGFGVCSDARGKTAVLIKFEDREEYLNNYNFTPYLCEGLYPVSLVQANPELTITLGKSLFAGERGDPGITITNDTTDDEIILDPENDFSFIDGDKRTIIIKNIAFKIEKSTSFKVKIDNVYDENGVAVRLEYSTNLFELKDDPDPVDPSNPDNPDNPDESGVTSDVYNIDKENKIITGIEPGTTIAEIKKNINYNGYTLKFINYRGNEVKSGTIGSTAKLQFIRDSQIAYEYHVVIFGELTGEGNINSRDFNSIYNHLLGKTALEGYFLMAADTNHDGTVNTLDLLRISKHIRGEEKITQKK